MMTPYYQHKSITLYCGDAFSIMPALSPVSHVITDPPYEKEAHTAGRRLNGRNMQKGVRRLHSAPLSFSAITSEQRLQASEWFAKLSTGWILTFCQAEAVALWRDALEANGATYKRAMIWVKPDSAPQLSGDRPAMGYESIVAAWASKGRSSWNGGGKRGVFTHCKHDSGMGHGGAQNEHETRKPISLMMELVALFTDPQDVILDPFAGSGTTLLACKELGRAAIGIEAEERHCETIAKRLAQEVLF